jgi:hypothetical protein
MSQYPTSKQYYRAITIKTAWYWHKNGHKGQWIRLENLDINWHSYRQSTDFWQRYPKHTIEKNNLFNKCCWDNWISTCRQLKLAPCLSPCTKINSKWIKGLNIRPETLKQLQEVVRNTLEHISIEDKFLNGTLTAQHLQERLNKWDCTKQKSFCTVKETVTKLKRKTAEMGEKSLPAIHLIKD